jgi:NAD(P)-dependent dehydrogenase (short-subunit alcohol dehydrogenase family)
MDLFEGKGGRLEGKVAVVTGGGSGIGLAIVKEFLKQGAKVAIASRTAYDLGDLPERLRLNAIAVAADVSKNDDLTRLFDKTAEAFRKIDVVVANAGVSKFAPLEQITEDDFRWIFDINVKGMFFTVQKALPHLNSGASIILTTSLGGHTGTPGGTMYNASKAAGRSLARTLAADLVGRNIRVNALSPGATDTPIFERFGLSDD